MLVHFPATIHYGEMIMPSPYYTYYAAKFLCFLPKTWNIIGSNYFSLSPSIS